MKREFYMIEKQSIFNKTLQEIKLKIDSPDQYDILMVSGLIRKLLIDGENSLIHQIDKENKKVRFNVNFRQPLHARMPDLFKGADIANYFWSAENGLDPLIADKRRGYNLKSLNLDDFLECPVMFAKGELITIRDLVKHLSDKEGGIHKQKAPIKEVDIKNIIMHELARMIEINNLPTGLNVLRSISSIVCRDLSVFVK